MTGMFAILALIYAAIGAAVTVKTWEPEQGGWVWVVLLWPLQLGARVMNYPHPMDDTIGFDATDEELGLTTSDVSERMWAAIENHLAVIDKYPNATRNAPGMEQSIEALRAALRSARVILPTHQHKHRDNPT